MSITTKDPLLERAGNLHKDAMRSFYQNEGHYGGSVRAKRGNLIYKISHGDDGSFLIERRSDKYVDRLELGPSGWHGSRTEKVVAPSGNTINDHTQINTDDLYQQLFSEIEDLHFSAGERGRALRCSLCANPPESADMTGHFALCPEHYSEWLEDGNYGFSQFILYRLGLWERALEEGEWEEIVLAEGLSAREPLSVERSHRR